MTIKKLSVVYISGTLGLGGAERELVNQIKALLPLGVSISVINIGNEQNFKDEILNLGAEIYQIKHDLSKIHKLILIIRLIYKLQPSIIHSQHFYTNLYALFASKILRIPVIGSVQNDLNSEIKANGIFGKPSFLWLPNLSTNSTLAYDRIISFGFPSKNLFLLRNAIDLDIYDKSIENLTSKKNNDPFTIITIGRLVKQKRIDIFIRLIQRLHLKFHIEALVIGAGPLQKELINYSKELRLEKIVKFLGPSDNIPQLLSKSDLFVLCSDHEGMPNVIQEAMAAGLPIVSTNVGELYWMVENGVNGYLVSPNDENDLFDKTKIVIEDVDLQKLFGIKSRRIAEEKFSLNRLQKALIEIYVRVINNFYG